MQGVHLLVSADGVPSLQVNDAGLAASLRPLHDMVAELAGSLRRRPGTVKSAKRKRTGGEAVPVQVVRVGIGLLCCGDWAVVLPDTATHQSFMYI